ncbi:thioesterase II family protein [Nonomuraea candida]|uniref:thioesterase II family protein n=1 Tax=Nonomuraea candida TaxID=359159 RepID=UPI0005BD663A|nr:alpha/beta fold hydrolase [Nonomuraea candida]
MTTISGWDVRWDIVEEPRMRLFCAPHAGGGAGVYRAWAQLLAPEIEVVAIRLPGREMRYGETPRTSTEQLVPELVRGVAPLLDRPHAWFGHSMGALIAFESCRWIRRAGLPEPARLLVSGRSAPQLPLRGRPVHDAPTPELVRWLRVTGGTPPELLDDPALFEALLPMLRADMTVAETYRYRPEPPLSCPMSIYGGSDDEYATPEELRPWERQTTGECRLRLFQGGHFFIHDMKEQILPVLGEDLLEPTSHAAGPAAR